MLLYNFCINNSKGPDPATMTEAQKRQHETSFRVWYHESRENISFQHEIVSAVTYGDRAMEKSAPRSEMVNLLMYLRVQRRYGQTRFDSNDSYEDIYVAIGESFP